MKRLSKYGAVATVVDGVRFASKAEAKRDAELKLLARVGEVSHIERQPRFPLRVAGQLIGTYVGDWSYIEYKSASSAVSITRVVEDKKGIQTPAFKLKWKLAKALYPGIEWRLS